MPTKSSAPTKVILGCAKCGASLPDGAQRCPECDHPVSLPPKQVTVVEVGTSHPQPAKPKRHVFVWMLLVVLVGTIGWAVVSDDPYAQGVQEIVGWKHDQTILENPFSVTAHSFRYYKFDLPEGSTNVAIIGQFTVSAEENKAQKPPAKDLDNDIEVYVLSEPAFAVWQNGYVTSTVYESGRVSAASVNAPLPAGAGVYYLIFNNKFDPKNPKNLNATFLLRYKSWLPAWLRKEKDSLWNWLGL